MSFESIITQAKRHHWPMVERIATPLIKQKVDVGAWVDQDSGMTLMMLACKSNYFRVIEILVRHHPSVNDVSDAGLTVLNIAAQYSTETIVRLLLQIGADPSISGKNSRLPIHYSCQRRGGCLPVTKLLLSQMPPDYRLNVDNRLWMPISYAVALGNVPLIHLLLERLRAEQVAWREPETNNTLLHFAIKRQEIATVRVLIEEGKMEANDQNVDGRSPMHTLVVESCDMVLLKCLHVDGHGSANLPDNNDSTPCHYAATYGRSAFMCYMIDRMDADSMARQKDGSTLMHLSALLGHHQNVIALIERGAPLHMANKDKMTPLHLAAQHGHKKVVKILLDQGAPIEAKDKNNFSALHHAVLNNHPDVVELLIGCGACIGVRGGKRCETPLHLASRQSYGYDCARMLILSGADVNARNGEKGESPLHIASRLGHSKLVSLFLNDGAQARLVSTSEETALHLAVSHSHYSIAKVLLKFASDRSQAQMLVNMATNEGETALHMACELLPCEGVRFARLLLEHGADLLAATKLTMEIPLHYAARCKNVPIMLEMGKYVGADYYFIANRQSKNGWSPLLTAAYYGHEDIVKCMLDREVRGDVFDEHGLGALHLAAAKGFTRCCELLLSRKAFINAKSKLGLTPLHLAAKNGYSKLVKNLIKVHGATVEALSLAKRTPLHLAAENGCLNVVQTLYDLKANVRARDSDVGLPIHLAAKYNHHEVVKFFLSCYPDLAFSSTTKEGMLCSHLAAISGSVAVIRELLRFDTGVVIASRSRETESLPIHMAALQGNSEVVRIVMDAGASPLDEDAAGMTTLHCAAINGHLNVFEAVRSRGRQCNIISKKNGLSPLHIAAFYGNTEVVRKLLAFIPADIKTEASEDASIKDENLRKITSLDHGFSPLGFAAFAGHDAVVRLLLNSYGVDVQAKSSKSGFEAMHLASMNGHLVICSLLLAKSAKLLEVRSKSGVVPLMLSAQYGHCELVTNFVGQGANVNSVDDLGWSALFYASRFGRLEAVSLLIELGATTLNSSYNRKTPLGLAAASGHIDVFYFLLKHDFDDQLLLKDDEFIFDLMNCGRSNKHVSPIEEFALVSPSPLSTAATLTRRFRELSATNKQHSKELLVAARFSEKMASSLVEIAITQSSASAILQAMDSRGRQLIDMMLEDGLKTVMAKASVQRYLTDVWWDGNLGWSNFQLILLFLIFLFFPPIMAFFVLPLPHKYHRIPVIRFIGYIVSHLTFIVVLVITVVIPIYPNRTRTSHLPTWNEYLLLIWLGGNLTAELTNPSGYKEIRFIKIIIFAFSSVAMLLQLIAIIINDVDSYEADMIMYIRNQVLSVPVFLSLEMILDFTALNHRFGPMIIILKYMVEEVQNLIALLIVFFIGFWLQLNTIYSPTCPDLAPDLTLGCICNARVPENCIDPYLSAFRHFEPGCRSNSEEILATLTTNLQLLWMSLTHHGEYNWQAFVRNTPTFALLLTRAHLFIFHIIMVLIFLSLMTAVSAEVFERMHRRSDLEWKFGRAKLIRGMIKTAPTPSPLNLIVKPFMYLKALIKYKKGMCSTMSEAAYYLMLIEDAAGVFDMDEDENMQKAAIARHASLATFYQQPERPGLLANRLSEWLKGKTNRILGQRRPGIDIGSARDGDLQGVSFYKRGHQHYYLKEVVDWEAVILRYREIKADSADEEDAVIQEVGMSLSEMEDWQQSSWLEMLEIEDEDLKRERRKWLINEFNSVVKT